jgi:hypothetical protein
LKKHLKRIITKQSGRKCRNISIRKRENEDRTEDVAVKKKNNPDKRRKM